MVTPRISYAHLLAEPNPKHVESLLKFFEAGRSKRGTGGLGVEIEHLPVHDADDTAVSYYEPNGIEAFLKRLAPYYDESKEYWENGHLVGLAREGVAVSLEPGGQVEASIGVLHEPGDLNGLYADFRCEADPILEELGFRFVNYGYQPKSSFVDVPVNPKGRYDAMTDFLGRVGQFGPCMMRCSASTQVSIDYVDEKDSIDKMRVGTAIGPILAWFFRNTPYFEGRLNPYPLLRQRMWDYLDFQRTNVTPGLFDQRFGWEDYARDVLSTPLMFADLTHTPEAVESGLSRKELHRAAFRESSTRTKSTTSSPRISTTCVSRTSSSSATGIRCRSNASNGSPRSSRSCTTCRPTASVSKATSTGSPRKTCSKPRRTSRRTAANPTRMASRSTSGVSSSASRACSTIFPEIRSTPTCSSADRVPCRP